MGIVFRQSIKTTIITFTGAAFGALIVYLSTWLLPQQQFGFSKIILSQAVIASQLVLMGMHNMLYIFIYKYPPNDERRKVLITISTLVPFLITILFSGAYFLLKNQIVGLYQIQDIVYVTRFFAWLPIYALLWAIMTLLEQYLISQMKVAISVFVREVLLRLLNIVLVVLVGTSFISFDNFIVLSIVIHIIPICILWYLCTKTEGFGFSIKWTLFSKTNYKEISDFAFYHLLINVSITLLVNIDMLMIGVLDKSGVVAVAIYSVAIYIISIFQIPYRSLASSAAPMLNKAYEQKEMAELKDMFNRSGINILIVAIGMALLILCNMNNAIRILDTGYAAIALVVPVLMIGRLADMSTGLNNEILSISKYYRFSFYITIILLVVIITLNYLLIPKYGILGAAWANTIGFCFFNVIKLLFLWRKLDLQPLSKNSLYTLIAATPAALAGYLIPALDNPYADTLVRSTAIIVLFVAALIYIKPSPDIKKYLQSVRENKRLF